MFGAIILWGVLAGKACADSPMRMLGEYQTDSVQRMQTLMYQSENLRQCQSEIDRFWMVDQPSHLTANSTRLPPLPGCTTPLDAVLGGIGSVLAAAQTVVNTPETTRRTDTLMYQSESSGMIFAPTKCWYRECWDRINDQPSHLTPDRTHGGVR